MTYIPITQHSSQHLPSLSPVELSVFFFSTYSSCSLYTLFSFLCFFSVLPLLLFVAHCTTSTLLIDDIFPCYSLPGQAAGLRGHCQGQRFPLIDTDVCQMHITDILLLHPAIIPTPPWYCFISDTTAKYIIVLWRKEMEVLSIFPSNS